MAIFKKLQIAASFAVLSFAGGCSMLPEGVEELPTPMEFCKPKPLPDVNFYVDRSALTPKAREVLDKTADDLKASIASLPGAKFAIRGHTDSDASDAYNMGLSKRRAQSVRRYLAKKGVPFSNTVPEWFGERQPIADNKTAKGKAKNRRVEVMLLDANLCQGS
jgi:outer membrane protein OmpA-like peptidoglycan-associated protein